MLEINTMSSDKLPNGNLDIPFTIASIIEENLDQQDVAVVLDTCCSKEVSYADLGPLGFLYVSDRMIQQVCMSPNCSITIFCDRATVLEKLQVENTLTGRFSQCKYRLKLHLLFEQMCRDLPDPSPTHGVLVGRIVANSIIEYREGEEKQLGNEFICRLGVTFGVTKHWVLLQRHFCNETHNFSGVGSQHQAERAIPVEGIHIFFEPISVIQPAQFSWVKFYEIDYFKQSTPGLSTLFARNYAIIEHEVKRAFALLSALWYRLPAAMIAHILLYSCGMETKNFPLFSPGVLVADEYFRRDTDTSTNYIHRHTKFAMASLAPRDYRLLLPPCVGLMLPAQKLANDMMHAQVVVRNILFKLMCTFANRPFDQLWSLVAFCPIHSLPKLSQ